MTHVKTNLKKFFSILMVVMMLLTAWVFVAPEKAEAANQGGKYTVRLLIQTIDDFDMSDSQSYATITYIKNDGSGSTGTKTISITNNVDNQKSIFNGGGANYGYFPNNAGVQIDGFPTSIYVSIYKTSEGWAPFVGAFKTDGGYHTWVQVKKSSNNWDDYGGTQTNNGNLNSDHQHGIADHNTGEVSTYKNTPITASFNITGSKPSYTLPSISGSSTIALGSSSSKTSSYSVTAPTDQYGVTQGYSWSEDSSNTTIANNGTLTANHSNSCSGYTTTVTCTFGMARSSDKATKLVSVTESHSYGNWTKVDDTNHKKTCSYNSNHVVTESHSWNDGTITTQPTCTATGVRTYTCPTCSGTKTGTEAALGHSFTNQTTTSTYLKTAANCVDKAVYYYKCSRCTEKGTSTYQFGSVNASNHKTTENRAAVAPTCEEGGYTAGVFCTACNKWASGHESVTALGHDYNYAGAVFNWNGFACPDATVTCTRATGHTDTESTTVTNAVTAEPAYDAAGVRTYTAKFTKNSTEYSDSKTDSIPALQTLINLDDVALEEVGGTSGKIALAPSKESDIDFEIVGFKSSGDHTLYKSANVPSTAETLKLDGVRISKVSGDTSKIAYKFTKMNFTNLQSFYALIKVTGTENHKYADSEIYTYQKITLVPAKNVFFDDTAEAIHYENSSDTSSGYGVWTRITDSGSDASTAADSFGDATTAQPNTENSVKYSFGDAHKVSVSSENANNPNPNDPEKNGDWPSAQFTFTGSGFDLISVTDSSSGAFIVSVYENETRIKRKVVDTYYGFSYGQLVYTWRHKIVIGDENDGQLLYEADKNTPETSRIYNGTGTKFYTTDPTVAVKENNVAKLAFGWIQNAENSDVMYQVPCISMDLGTVGTYKVVVEPAFTEMFGHYNEDGDVKYYNLIVDGVRIYNPADGNNEALAMYAENGETYTNYELIRNSSTLQSNYIVIEGMNNLTPSQLNAYLEGAPKNELCIMSGGTAAFDVDFTDLSDARLGLKAANGKACNVTITNGTSTITVPVNSSTEQYVSLKSLLASGTTSTITVTNGGEGILSLTKLMKASNTQSAVTKGALSVGPKTAPRAFAAVRMLNADLTIDEESVETTVFDEGNVILTLQTSEDAQTVVIRDADGNVVDPESIDFSIDETGVKNWTIVLADVTGDDPGAPGTYSYAYTLQAEYENGYAPEEPTTVTVTVTIPEPETEEEQNIDFGTSKFGKLFAKLIELIRMIISLFR